MTRASLYFSLFLSFVGDDNSVAVRAAAGRSNAELNWQEKSREKDELVRSYRATCRALAFKMNRSSCKSSRNTSPKFLRARSSSGRSSERRRSRGPRAVRSPRSREGTGVKRSARTKRYAMQRRSDIGIAHVTVGRASRQGGSCLRYATTAPQGVATLVDAPCLKASLPLLSSS